MPDLVANPRNLLDIVKLLVTYTGDRGLVAATLTNDWGDNGAYHYINAGMQYLEEEYFTPLGDVTYMERVALGQCLVPLKNLKVLKSAYFLDNSEARTRLEKKSHEALVEYYTSPLHSIATGAPVYYCLDNMAFSQANFYTITNLAPPVTSIYPPTLPGWTVTAPRWSVAGTTIVEVANITQVPLQCYFAAAKSGSFNVVLNFSALSGDFILNAYSGTTLVSTQYIDRTAFDGLPYIINVSFSGDSITHFLLIPSSTVAHSCVLASTVVYYSEDKMMAWTPGVMAYVGYMSTPGPYDEAMLLLPPPETAGFVEVHGDFYTPRFLDYDDLNQTTQHTTNYWTLKKPYTLAYAACRARAFSRRDMDAVASWDSEIQRTLRGLVYDKMENSWPEDGCLQMELN